VILGLEIEVGPISDLAPGLFISPTVLTDVQPGSRIEQEEMFGPVLSVLRWRDEEEAIAMANGVPYGLTASVWTNDLRRAHRVVRRLQAGFVWVNDASKHFLNVPFGGTKASGLGREEDLQELYSYTETKAVNVRL
jgi:betaine-aldehyde dehydrogenase